MKFVCYLVFVIWNLFVIWRLSLGIYLFFGAWNLEFYNSMNVLYIVSTPIGNLKDITLRAIETLKNVDVICAEDTRVTQKLLNHYDIKKPLLRCDAVKEIIIAEKIVSLLKDGKNVALVTDAGTPGISDPGARLVSYVNSQLSNVRIIPIPGPSALIVALSISGINANQFTFLGYPPHKKGRKTFFADLKNIETKPIVLYESPHRIAKTLLNLEETFGEEKEIIVCRELTKIHEEIFRGNIKKSQSHFQGEHLKGEFVIILS